MSSGGPRGPKRAVFFRLPGPSSPVLPVLRSSGAPIALTTLSDPPDCCCHCQPGSVAPSVVDPGLLSAHRKHTSGVRLSHQSRRLFTFPVDRVSVWFFSPLSVSLRGPRVVFSNPWLCEQGLLDHPGLMEK